MQTVPTLLYCKWQLKTQCEILVKRPRPACWYAHAECLAKIWSRWSNCHLQHCRSIRYRFLKHLDKDCHDVMRSKCPKSFSSSTLQKCWLGDKRNTTESFIKYFRNSLICICPPNAARHHKQTLKQDGTLVQSLSRFWWQWFQEEERQF